ncbi:MAG: deoxyribose-phosphate aldolase [Actinomycetota bacterium]|nr:deoxyribose-phosphate aldolase [Actinomycetota bacterium]
MSTVLAEIGADGRPGWTAPAPGGLGLAITPVDKVGLEQRAAELAGRSIKKDSKGAALRLAVRCIDLTTLEGADTPDRVRSLCAKARRPDPADDTVPPVAAVCVYPELVPVAVEAVAGSGVKVASVAGGFPAGLAPLEARLDEIRWVVGHGADEVDMVLNRSAFLSGRYRKAFDEIAASKEASGDAHLKVILETGELGSYDNIRKASMLAMAAGADVIKTSTGKINPASTLPTALCMAEAIRDFADQTGTEVGLKLAGGIRTAKQSWQYLVLVGETLGPAYLDPDRLRLGASSLLNDVLAQLTKLREGRYVRPERFSVD